MVVFCRAVATRLSSIIKGVQSLQYHQRYSNVWKSSARVNCRSINLDSEMDDGGTKQARGSSYSSATPRVAAPGEVNYALIQDMGKGFSRHAVPISALGTTFNMVYGEWVGVGRSREDSPVVLCLHGAPATEGAFRPIGNLIAAEGYRVLALNFPGNGYTEKDREGLYDCSTPHKVELVKAFLAATQIESVAMVIGHSLGSHIAGHLAADPEMEGKIESVCFLCGTGVKPYWVQKLSTTVPYLPVLVYKCMYLPVVGPLLTYIFSKIVYQLGFRGRTPEAQVLSIYEASQLRFDVYRRGLTTIAQQELPTLLLYSLNDTIVEPESIPEAIAVLGIAETNIKDYDMDGNSEFVFPDTTVRRVVRFANGTHRVQFTNPEKTAQEMVSLLHAVTSRH